MSTGKNPRLSANEYVTPEPDANSAVWMARADLIGAVRRIHRPMLNELSRKVFPAYAQLAQANFNELETKLWAKSSPHLEIPAGRLSSALERWATKFHCTPGWFLDETLRTLRGWYVAPDWRRSRRWNPIRNVTNTVAVGEPFHFQAPGWEPQLFSWSDYKRLLLKQFEEELKKYERACRALAESAGLIRVPHKYSPVNLDWFVRYQFVGLSPREIAQRDNSANSVDESVVLRGIKRAARLLAWGPIRNPRIRQIR